MPQSLKTLYKFITFGWNRIRIMLASLSIKNYAIIDELNIDFLNDLNIITGETGAGKSILLGALDLILGKRADTKSLYVDSKKCIVEATFDKYPKAVIKVMQAHELDIEDELIIRREISATGKSRAFVNDTPVNLKLLQEISSRQVNLHQQFDNLSLHSEDFQMEIIDALAGNKAALDQYWTLYKKYKASIQQLDAMRTANQNADREIDYIQFQLKEFDNISLVPGELVKWEEEINILQNAEGIKKALTTSNYALEQSDASVLSQLRTLSNEISPFKEIDDKLARLYQQLENCILELDDVSALAAQLSEDIEYSPEKINEIQGRLDQVYRLQKKHNVQSDEALLKIKSEFENQLLSFTDLNGEIEAKEKEIKIQKGTLEELAAKLHKKRSKAIPRFEKEIQKLLVDLAMTNAKLQVKLDTVDLNPTGSDKITFLFAANKGSKFLPIKQVASGGELSRLNLCVKSMVADSMELPTLIFDEIDSGVSGDVALKMGGILKELSRNHQVITITHSPQVAAHAKRHFYVYKQDKGNKTITNIRVLEYAEKIKVLATMLSKSPPSTFALENAKELLEN